METEASDEAASGGDMACSSPHHAGCLVSSRVCIGRLAFRSM